MRFRCGPEFDWLRLCSGMVFCCCSCWSWPWFVRIEIDCRFSPWFRFFSLFLSLACLAACIRSRWLLCSSQSRGSRIYIIAHYKITFSLLCVSMFLFLYNMLLIDRRTMVTIKCLKDFRFFLSLDVRSWFLGRCMPILCVSFPFFVWE